MLAISINVTWIPVILLVGIIIGFALRSQQIKKCKNRIISLENDMLYSHAEILRLQHDQVEMEKAFLRPSKTPVVTMKDLPQDNPEKEDKTKKKLK